MENILVCGNGGLSRADLGYRAATRGFEHKARRQCAKILRLKEAVSHAQGAAATSIYRLRGYSE